MIDRLVHHGDVLTRKGASYRLRVKAIDSLPSIRTTTPDTDTWAVLRPFTFRASKVRASSIRLATFRALSAQPLSSESKLAKTSSSIVMVSIRLLQP